MKQFRLSCWAIASLSCLVGVGVAAEPPSLKPGMWQIRIQHTADGKATVAPTTTKQCMVAGDMEKAQATAADYAKKNCSKNETRQSGTQWVTDMVCAVGAGTMTSHSVTDMASNSVYHTDATSTFDPPTAGHSRTNTIMDGAWLGPCSQE